MKHLFSPLAVCLATMLAAQKMPLGDGSARVVQVLDASAVLGKRDGADTVAALERVAAFLRAFAEPPLTSGQAISTLGERHIVVLADPEAAARIERLLGAAVARPDDHIQVTIQIADVSRACFEEHIECRLVPARDLAESKPALAQHRRLFGKADSKEVTGLLEELKRDPKGQFLIAPRLVAKPMEPATLFVGEHLSYTRDFEIKRYARNEPLVGDPVRDKVMNGTQTELLASHVGDGKIAIDCSVIYQSVDLPIASYTTTLGKDLPISLQLPRATGVKMRQSAVLDDGGTLVLAAEKRSDGRWLVAVVQTSTVKR